MASDCRRCPTTDALDLLFYSSDRLSWGVRFAVPKYQAFNSLYVACSAYICDSAVRSSEHCDRSCVSTPVATTRARRRRRRHGPADLERHQRLQTQFTVADDGFGPLIDNNGQLRLVRHTRQLHLLVSLFSSFSCSRTHSLHALDNKHRNQSQIDEPNCTVSICAVWFICLISSVVRAQVV